MPNGLRRLGSEMADNSESILLDTSVWIDALRGKTPHIVAATNALLNDDRILICGPVIFEIKLVSIILKKKRHNKSLKYL